MARKRKTIDVAAVLAEGNRLLALLDTDNGHICPAFRQGVSALLESVLMATGNYQGYNFNAWEGGGYTAWVAAGEPRFPEKDKYLGDQTARRYYGQEAARTLPHNAKDFPCSLESYTPKTSDDAVRQAEEAWLLEEWAREVARLNRCSLESYTQKTSDDAVRQADEARLLEEGAEDARLNDVTL